MIVSRSIMPCRTDLNQLDDPLAYHEHLLADLIQTDETTSRIFSCLFQILQIYKNDVRYKNSPRYLRLWIMYIFYLHRPLIYPTLFGLMDKEIGDKLAILYEAIAYQQWKEGRYHDAEASLLLGIRHQANPLARLNRDLQEFRLTGRLQFDIDQYKLESYNAPIQIDRFKRVHTTKKPRKEDSLKDQLNWINLKLQHAKRADALRQCYINQYSYEELRAKTQHHSLINMAQVIKKGGTNILGVPIYLRNPAIINPVQEKENDHQQQQQQQQHNVVQLPHNPDFITRQLTLTRALDRETYHLLDTTSARKDILNNLRDWFHIANRQNTALKRLIQLDKDTFHVVRQLGQGGLADVYLVQHTETFAYYGLKVQQPAHPWEYYIFCQIHGKKTTNISVLEVYDFYHYSDASFLLMYLIRNGTLLDALNLYRPSKSCMPEPIVLIIMMQLIEELIKLHHLQIAHNDLKLDNVMLLNTEITAEFPKVMMIDFGHAIDVSALPPHSLCIANWLPAHPKSDFPKLNLPYSPFHADYWQLATMAHLLLYGTPMFTLKDKSTGFYSIQQPIRRYWHKDIWIELFQTLLNPTPLSEENKLHELLSRFRQASQNLPQAVIKLFTSTLQEKTLINR